MEAFVSYAGGCMEYRITKKEGKFILTHWVLDTDNYPGNIVSVDTWQQSTFLDMLAEQRGTYVKEMEFDMIGSALSYVGDLLS